jgi:hypothetical protein
VTLVQRVQHTGAECLPTTSQGGSKLAAIPAQAVQRYSMRHDSKCSTDADQPMLHACRQTAQEWDATHLSAVRLVEHVTSAALLTRRRLSSRRGADENVMAAEQQCWQGGLRAGCHGIAQLPRGSVAPCCLWWLLAAKLRLSGPCIGRQGRLGNIGRARRSS